MHFWRKKNYHPLWRFFHGHGLRSAGSAFGGVQKWKFWSFARVLLRVRGYFVEFMDSVVIEPMNSMDPGFLGTYEFYGSNGSERCLLWLPSQSQEARCYDVYRSCIFGVAGCVFWVPSQVSIRVWSRLKSCFFRSRIPPALECVPIPPERFKRP